MKSKVALLLAVGVSAGAIFLGSACGGGEEPSGPAATTATVASTVASPTKAPQKVVSAARGIGVFPAEIDFGETLRAGEYFSTIGLINNENSEQTFRVEFDGEAAPWLSIVDPNDRTKVLDTVSAPPKDQARVFLRLVVPPDVPNGVHTGVARVLTTVEGTGLGENTGVSVNVGAQIDVTLNLTGTQKIAGSLIDMTIGDVEVGSPFRIKTTVQNSGNIQVNPQIDLQVLDPQGAIVGTASFSAEVVYPNEIKSVTPEWDTTDQKTGERIARVSVKFGNVDLGTREIHFNILPLGTLTRAGELEGLALEGTPSVGSVVKVVAQFRNIGQIDARAQFLGEVFRDSVRIDAATSEELVVVPGDVQPLELFVDVTQSGTYKVQGKVNYEGKETDVQELVFTVGGGGGLPIWAIAVGVVVAVLLLVSGGLTWVLLRRLPHPRRPEA
jgi:hypothetical protein